MNKNISMIKLIITLVSVPLIFACSSHLKNNIKVHLINDTIVIHNDIWVKNVFINGCDVNKLGTVLFKVDSIKNMLYVYSPCCYLRSFEMTKGSIIDSIRINCYNGEKNFTIGTFSDYIVMYSNQRIWLFTKKKLRLFASLIDTINEYKPVKGGDLYSFEPTIEKDSFIVNLMYKKHNNDSINEYKICFYKSISFSGNTNFYKIPKHDFVKPSVEDTLH